MMFWNGFEKRADAALMGVGAGVGALYGTLIGASLVPKNKDKWRKSLEAKGFKHGTKEYRDAAFQRAKRRVLGGMAVGTALGGFAGHRLSSGLSSSTYRFPRGTATGPYDSHGLRDVFQYTNEKHRAAEELTHKFTNAMTSALHETLQVPTHIASKPDLHKHIHSLLTQPHAPEKRVVLHKAWESLKDTDWFRKLAE